MPKLIDHEARKVMIAEAMWRIILEQGAEGASVRNIAKEAGLSLGSMRYYFHSQKELMNYSRELIFERISQRVDQIFTSDQNPKDKIIEVLMELLPPTGNLEQEIKVRLLSKSFVIQEKEAADGGDAVFLAVKNVMSNLLLLNLMKKELDIGTETERLYVLIDGMALESLVRPNVLTANRVEEIVVYHLNSICRERIK